jgi:mannitol-1-phosphate 5-dehydrogenase
MSGAVHFGAGNIGRGFIGEVLFRNGFHIDFVDINETIIGELHRRSSYTIEFADKERDSLTVHGVDGINSKTEPEKVIAAIAGASLVTTAIGPGVLPFIAKTIALGLEARAKTNDAPLDIIACENMIGGSEFLAGEVKKHLSPEGLDYVRRLVGFPNAAVDRIVPAQKHDDPLAVSVERFKEWIITRKDRKAADITLEGVMYVDDLQPYIERKLFSVNTGHASTAYLGARFGHTTIDAAVADPKIAALLKKILAETGSLLVAKWGFDGQEHRKYIDKIIGRFENPNNPDTCARVAREPIRKLGFNERFIRPIRELKERGLPYGSLLEASAFVLSHDDPSDAESVKLQALLKDCDGIERVIADITGLSDGQLIAEIAETYAKRQ